MIEKRLRSPFNYQQNLSSVRGWRQRGNYSKRQTQFVHTHTHAHTVCIKHLWAKDRLFAAPPTRSDVNAQRSISTAIQPPVLVHQSFAAVVKTHISPTYIQRREKFVNVQKCHMLLENTLFQMGI